MQERGVEASITVNAMTAAFRLILVVCVFVPLFFVSEVRAPESTLAVPPVVEDEYASVRKNPEVRMENKNKRICTKRRWSSE